MPNKKQHASRKANARKVRRSRKLSGKKSMSDALRNYEDRIQAIHAGWDHI